MGKGNRSNTWSRIIADEIGETSGGGGKHKREESFVNEMYDEDWEKNGSAEDEMQQQVSDVLRLHNSDNPGMQLVAVPLTGTNFLNWSRQIKRALGAKSKLELLDGSLAEPDPSVAYYKQWIKVDYMVSCWIINSISKELVNSFSHYDTTKKLWDALCRRFDRSNGPKIAKLEKEIRGYEQGNLTVMDYFSNLTILWDEMDMVLPPVGCTCHARRILEKREEDRRLVQFLLGLNDMFENTRSQILLMEPLPSVDKAYSMVAQVEDEKSMKEGVIDDRGQLALYAQKNTGFQSGVVGERFNQKERWLSKEERRKLRCSHCKENGHESHEYFKLHGYPDWYKRLRENKGRARINYVGDFADDASVRSGEGYEPKPGLRISL